MFSSFIKKIIPKSFLNRFRPIYHYLFSFLAHVFYGKASNKIIVIGVTGTSGKTSSVYLMAKTLNNAGYKTGYTSTAMFSDGNNEWLNNKKMTMLGKFFTQKMLNKMVKNKCVYAVIETTSEGIKQFRHRFINYDVVCFTSLYPEHIESHGSFENYKQAKAKLFSHLKNCKTKYVDGNKRVVKIKTNLSKINFNKVKKTIIVNGDDEHSFFFSGFWAEEKLFYYKGDFADKDENVIFYNNILVDKNEISFDVLFKQKLSSDNGMTNKRVSLSLLGEFNVLNSMPLLALSVNQEINLDLILDKLKEIKNIPGRLEIVDAGQKFLAIVDYAYEPVAMKKLYNTIDFIRENRKEKGKIIHILGSTGGGRDKSRRFTLGEIAGEKADFVIISNEDPYDENPLDIINQVASGSKAVGKIEGENLFRVLDRREAIKKSLSLVGDNDIVLLTGKGSEQAICVAGGKKIKWDDRVVLRGEIINKVV
jgi:UDP-N-acetylmuramoyl-L-alanyl-D-glutamate--2,6-diaminopimelate ligase